MKNLPQNNYRNPKLLKLASKCPYCCYCGKPNDGTIVACHFNAIKFGKGMGIKSHDIPAMLCEECHALSDGRIGATVMDKKDRELVLYEGVYRTFLWLLSDGYLVLSKEAL